MVCRLESCRKPKHIRIMVKPRCCGIYVSSFGCNIQLCVEVFDPDRRPSACMDVSDALSKVYISTNLAFWGTQGSLVGATSAQQRVSRGYELIYILSIISPTPST